MSKPNETTVFALKAWSIKVSWDGEKFFIAPTACFTEKPDWSKAHGSLQAACSAIARKLAEEWTARNDRQRKFYGRKERAR